MHTYMTYLLIFVPLVFVFTNFRSRSELEKLECQKKNRKLLSLNCFIFLTCHLCFLYYILIFIGRGLCQDQFADSLL